MNAIRAFLCLTVLACWGNSARADSALQPLDLRQVKVGGALGQRIDLTVEKNILAIDHDRSFLKYFREKQRPPFSYVGLGKEIDALVRLAYYTQDRRLVELKQRVVRETIRSQLDDGYIGIFAGDRINQWWDLHELSYIIYGLVQDYRYFGNQEALAAARRAADYVIEHRTRRRLVFHVSTIGFERAFLALAAAAKDPKYLEQVNFQDSLAGWRDDIGGHTYDYLSLCLGQLDLYEQRQNPRLLDQSQRVVRHLTANNGLLIDGSCSLRESWDTTQAGRGDVGETCVTSYLIRLWDRLLQIEGDSLYGDLMERAIYNALFAAQSSDGRELRKYTAIEGPREFYRGEAGSDFQRDTYCCPNNFRRAIADLPGLIYYQGENAVVVNLYCESKATLTLDKDLKVQLEQQTDYPNSSEVLLTLQPSQPADFALRLRIPRWCSEAKVTINGKVEAAAPRPGTFYTIRRKWSGSEKVKLQMDMPVRLVRGRASQSGKAAVMRGPMVFCLNPVLNADQEPAMAGFHGERGRQRQAIITEINNIEAQLLVPEGLPDSPDGTPAKPSPQRVALREREAKLKRDLAVYRPTEAVMRDLSFSFASLTMPQRDGTVRPNGLGLAIDAWGPGADRKAPPNLKLRLTEFSDPQGEMTFLPCDRAEKTVDDELFLAPATPGTDK